MGPVAAFRFAVLRSVFGRSVVLVVIHLDGPGLEELEHPLNQRVFRQRIGSLGLALPRFGLSLSASRARRTYLTFTGR